MRGTRIALFLCMIQLGAVQWGLPAFAQSSIQQEAVAHLRVVCESPETGEVFEPVGSGALIKNSGYILTANHVVSCVNPASKSQMKRKSITVRLGSNADARVYRAQVEKLSNEDDVAVLRIMGSHATFPRIAACAFRDIKPGATFVAAGFPEGEDYQPVDGRVGSIDTDGRWNAAAPFARGMSGGPVVIGGRLVGVVKGGLHGIDAVRKIIPIQKAKTIIEDATGIFLDNCGREAKTVEHDVRVCNRTAADLLISTVDYDTTDKQWMARSSWQQSPGDCIDLLQNEAGMYFYIGVRKKKTVPTQVTIGNSYEYEEFCIKTGGMNEPAERPPCKAGYRAMHFAKFVQPKQKIIVDLK